MNITELKNYAFTIQVPGFKKVNYDGLYVQYKDLTNEQQEDFIYRVVKNTFIDSETIHFEIKFEKHKDGRTHAHGTLYQFTGEQLSEFIDSVAFQIGVKSPKQKNEVCYCIPILCSYIWREYINKEQTKPGDDKLDFTKYLHGKLNK